jgi:hypothetical protein
MFTATAGLMLGGCGDEYKGEAQAEHYRDMIADDLEFPGQSDAEIDNRIRQTKIVNLRSINQDWIRLWLLDRPRRSMDYVTITD